MYGKEQNGQITNIYGRENVIFSTEVFQPAHTLTAEQRQQFSVVEIQEVRAPNYNTITHRLLPATYEQVNGAWMQVWSLEPLPEPTPAELLALQQQLIEQAYRNMRQAIEMPLPFGDLMIDAGEFGRSMLQWAKLEPRPSRKILTMTAPAELTSAQMDLVWGAIEERTQQLQDTAHALGLQIMQAATREALAAIDTSV